MSRMNQRFRGFGGALMSVLAATEMGCGSQFREVHYLKSAQQPPNYYRVTVSGNTSWSSARYLSGYFDEAAVDTYFSEFAQPNKGHFGDTVNSDETGKVVPLGATDADRRKLVMILSTNTDDVATSISSLAQSEAVTQTLVNIVSRDHIAAANAARSNAAGDAAAGAALATRGDVLLGQMGSPAERIASRTALLTYVNELAHFVDPSVQFTTLNDAEQWARVHNLDRNGGSGGAR